MQTKQKTALRELTLSAVKNCTTINKENSLFLMLLILLNYGYVGETALVFSTPTQIIVAAVYGAGTAFTGYEIMAVRGFDFITADIAANGVFDNQYESSFVKSSFIRFAP